MPCALFLIAAFRHYRWQAWRVSATEHLLLVSLIIAAACHGMFMTFSKEVSDAMFDVAHALKAVSYATVLTGLLASPLLRLAILRRLPFFGRAFSATGLVRFWILPIFRGLAGSRLACREPTTGITSGSSSSTPHLTSRGAPGL